MLDGKIQITSNKFQISITNSRRTHRASAGAAGAPALRVTKTIKSERIK